MKFERLGLIIVLAGLMVDVSARVHAVSYITCHQLADKNGYTKCDLINVLPRYICSNCIIPDSVNIPVHTLDKKLKNNHKWPRDSKVVVYCAGGSCTLSKYAYEIFKNNGFNDVMVLEEGLS